MAHQTHSGQGKPAPSKDKQGEQQGTERPEQGKRSGGNDRSRNPGNFANDPQRAREAGQKGGQGR